MTNRIVYRALPLAALLLVACGPDRRDGDGTCEPSCDRRACGTDGCGGTCGTCGEGTTCADGTCVLGCTPTTCEASGKDCGELPDGCGGTLACGTCSAGTCGGGGVANVCAPCTPESDGTFCQRLAKNCDSVTAADNCGTARTVSCGTCSTGTCGGGGTANVCGTATCANADCRVWTATVTGSNDSINWMWGSSANNVFAVGDHGEIIRWNGTTWSAGYQGGPTRPTEGMLMSVWGAGNEVWAVGVDGTILHGTGGNATTAPQWAAQTTPTTQALNSVWGSGTDDVWAVGDSGTILHSSDGDTWTVSEDLVKHLWGVWGSGPADVWAVGEDGMARHWNGTSWTSERAWLGTDNLYAVWGSGGEVWTVGIGGTAYRRRTGDTAWTSVPMAVDGTGFYAVWGTGPDDVYAAGHAANMLARGLLMHWNGSAWHTIDGLTDGPLMTVWGTTSTIWVKGSEGPFYRGVPAR